MLRTARHPARSLAPLAALVALGAVGDARAEDSNPVAEPEVTAEPAAAPGEARAEVPPGATDGGKKAHPGDHLTIYAMTFSPGDHPFFKFGHNAIWIHDAASVRAPDKVYNWGTFSFGDPALIPKFVVGRFMYWLSAQSLSATKRTYKRENRWVEVQELDLTPEQRVALRDAVEENLKDENKYYKYDYFGDNCSTRVRDHLDRATGGALKKVADGSGRLTLRQHMLRVTADTPAFAVVLSLALGDLIDKPPTKWAEAYLPGELQKTLREVKLRGPDGAERPLVKGEQRIVDADRADPPREPPRWLPYFLAAGAALGGVVAGLGWAARKGSRAARVAFGAGLAGACVVLGFLGLFFLFVWTLTDHVAGYGNENMFVCTPFAWALVGGAIGVARGKQKSLQRAATIASAAAAVAVLGVLVKVLPWFDQDNAWFLALLVPPWVAAAWSLRGLALAQSEPEPAGTRSEKAADAEAPAKGAKAAKGASRPKADKADEADEAEKAGETDDGEKAG